MKKLLAIILFTGTLATGCHLDTKNNHSSSGLNRMQDPTEDVTYKGPSHTIQNHSATNAAEGQFGYVHYSRKKGDEHALTAQHIPKTDYQALSDIITRQALTLPDIYDAGTLVTDEYVLIGYKTSNKDREQSASQVRQAALAVVPNYYKVVVSDEANATSDIARFKDFNARTSNVHHWLQAQINQMKKAPQGYAKQKNIEKNVDDQKKETRTLKNTSIKKQH
ncbi:hypothetical protein GCM10011391_29160 [Pullulanibacillus camelliae]|uniref:Sporulation protein n=1 Tax=Pullulanibacillus camelliae TaxID=1707096 RepID=A0A8J3DVZ0_9BACL|nr:YhcN/YlaJ family sporulation lipoprotein [Pullulanibacillus camelliae]GGE48514.1 hypothetical protein GCM10011391_29160 [Pullulanibacillus camelliae]